MNYYLCVDNFNGMLPLTIGRVYTSTRETDDLIWVADDLANEYGHARDAYFRKIEADFIESYNEN